MTALTSGVLAQAYAGPVEAFILGKVAKLYSPLSALVASQPPLLHAIATREIIYRVSMSRLMTQFPSSQAGKATIQVQHDEDMKLLAEIAAGEVTLLDSSLQIIEPSQSNVEFYSTTMGYNPTMHEGSYLDMVRDETKLDDIIDARLGVGLTE